MEVTLKFDNGDSLNEIRVSPDLLNAGKSSSTSYAVVKIPSYGRTNESSRVFQCKRDDTLPIATVCIPHKSYKIPVFTPTVGFCQFELLDDDSMLYPRVLDRITFKIDKKLYSKMIELPSDTDRAQFISARLNIQNVETIVREDQQFLDGMLAVANCEPGTYGTIDFKKTKIVLLEGDVMSHDEGGLAEESMPSVVRLQTLSSPVPDDLLPVSHASEKRDNTLFVFADHSLLSNLMINSGSHVYLTGDGISLRVQLFVLLQPHDFNRGTLYVHPRVKAMFPSVSTISIEKCIDTYPLPTASSVSIARVGDWIQCQKQFQNIIIHQFKTFFTTGKRVLRIGDLIPIVFDSSYASLLSENPSDMVDVLPCGDDETADTLVWFKVTEANAHRDGEDSTIQTEFTVNPGKTKLVTSGIVSVPSRSIINKDYSTYYRLPQQFTYDSETFPYYKQLHKIIESSIQCIEKGIDVQNFILLHSTSNNVGKSTLVRAIAAEFSTHLIEFDCFSLLANQGSMDAANKAMGYLKAKLEGVLPYTQSAIIYMSHLDVLFPSVDPNQDPTTIKIARSLELELFKIIKSFMAENKRIIFVASVNDIEHLPNTTRALFRFEVSVPVPTEAQRHAIFEWCMSDAQLNSGLGEFTSNRLALGNDVTISHLAVHSAGLTPIDIQSIVTCAKSDALRSRPQGNHTTPLYIGMDSVSKAIGDARDEFSVSIGAPKIPNVTWDDIGGVDQVKGEIMDTIDMPLKHPELFASGMKKRSGLLFYGPPGTGKTLMAKAIASNFSLNFFSVKGPELLNMYIGESEANVRRVFQRAREAKPCVIFFDEIDSVAPKRGNQGDSGGVMDRIVSQLLAELDGMSGGKGGSSDGIFVIGATNRPDLLDEALLRPGRFDKLLYLGISDTDEKQLNILKALTRKFDLGPDVDLALVASKCPFNYTGADFYALCSDAMLKAMTRTAATVDSKLQQHNTMLETKGEEPVSLNYWFDQVATPEDTAVSVQMHDFTCALSELVPSVSQQELDHYLRVKHEFET